jgi:hypothetical protein
MFFFPVIGFYLTTQSMFLQAMNFPAEVMKAATASMAAK